MEIGIKGRMLIYLHNYITERKFYLKINNETSEWQTSKVGILQGSVLSPLLGNLYTSDVMKKIRIKLHSEFADDNTVLSHGIDIDEVEDDVTKDCDNIINEWCPKWNMQTETRKPQAVQVPPRNVIKPTVNFKIRDNTTEQVAYKKSPRHHH